MPSKPLAISYIRFSTSKQEEGNSFDRQYNATVAYCEQHGLRLAEEKFYDLGVSAFYGANRREGRLRDLIEEIKKGKIPKGSYLIVESLDRLSRDKVGYQIAAFLEILNHGVNIVTLFDGVTHSFDRINEAPASLMIAIVAMMRANEESETKSKRGRAAWENKRRLAREGVVITRIMPYWLTVENGKIVPIPERAAIVREIFEDCKSGLGKRAIAKKLNARKEPVWGSSKRNKSGLWNDSFVTKVLHNRAVLGEHQPHLKRQGKRTVEGEVYKQYFPRIISDDDFYLAQARCKDRQGKGGRTVPKACNLLSGIARCAVCGGRMTYQKKAEGEEYIRCRAAHLSGGSCKAPAVNYLAVERFLATSLTASQWEQLLRLSDSEEKLEETIASRAAEIETIDSKISKLTELALLAPDVKQFGEKIRDCAKLKGKLESEIESLRAKASKRNTRLSTDETALLASLHRKLDPEKRRALRTILDEQFSAFFLHRSAVGEAAVLGLLKNGKVLLGRERLNDEKASFQLVLAPWQLRSDGMRRTIFFSLRDDGAGQKRLETHLLTIAKGVDPIAKIACPELTAILQSEGIVPSKLPKFSLLNKNTEAQFEGLKKSSGWLAFETRALRHNSFRSWNLFPNFWFQKQTPSAEAKAFENRYVTQ